VNALAKRPRTDSRYRDAVSPPHSISSRPRRFGLLLSPVVVVVGLTGCGAPASERPMGRSPAPPPAAERPAEPSDRVDASPRASEPAVSSEPSELGTEAVVVQTGPPRGCRPEVLARGLTVADVFAAPDGSAVVVDRYFGDRRSLRDWRVRVLELRPGRPPRTVIDRDAEVGEATRVGDRIAWIETSRSPVEGVRSRVGWIDIRTGAGSSPAFELGDVATLGSFGTTLFVVRA
jgi:hypothetical protein